MPLFGNKQQANLRVCIQMVEDAITALGHAPAASRIEEAPEPTWTVRKGNAHVHVQLTTRGEDNVLRVVAPVLHLTPEVDELPLFRHLLEENGSQIAGAAFALRDGAIVLCAERTTLDLDPSEVLDMVKRVEDYADEYDHRLVARFGGRAARPSGAPG